MTRQAFDTIWLEIKLEDEITLTEDEELELLEELTYYMPTVCRQGDVYITGTTMHIGKEPMPVFQPNETIEMYVERRIKAIFSDLAEMIADSELPEDVAAGVPFVLFSRERVLLNTWRELVGQQEDYVEATPSG